MCLLPPHYRAPTSSRMSLAASGALLDGIGTEFHFFMRDPNQPPTRSPLLDDDSEDRYVFANRGRLQYECTLLTSAVCVVLISCFLTVGIDLGRDLDVRRV
jgi:hypothetical protein